MEIYKIEDEIVPVGIKICSCVLMSKKQRCSQEYNMEICKIEDEIVPVGIKNMFLCSYV